MTEPWGYRLTFSVYFANDLLSDMRLNQIMAAVGDAVKENVPGLTFVGARLDPVKDEPKGQVAT